MRHTESSKSFGICIGKMTIHFRQINFILTEWKLTPTLIVRMSFLIIFDDLRDLPLGYSLAKEALVRLILYSKEYLKTNEVEDYS